MNFADEDLQNFNTASPLDGPYEIRLQLNAQHKVTQQHSPLVAPSPKLHHLRIARLPQVHCPHCSEKFGKKGSSYKRVIIDAAENISLTNISKGHMLRNIRCILRCSVIDVDSTSKELEVYVAIMRPSIAAFVMISTKSQMLGHVHTVLLPAKERPSPTTRSNLCKEKPVPQGTSSSNLDYTQKALKFDCQDFESPLGKTCRAPSATLAAASSLSTSR